MRLVLERVKGAKLSVDNELVSEINTGLIVLVGVVKTDTKDLIKRVANKIATMRIFEVDGKMNQSVMDVGGEVLLVSNFTLCTKDTSGARPDFGLSADKDLAKSLYLALADELDSLGVIVKRGVFGADMKIQTCLDGPVTIFKEIN